MSDHDLSNGLVLLLLAGAWVLGLIVGTIISARHAAKYLEE